MTDNLVRSRYRALDGACLTCSGDLASIAALPGVRDVDPLASGLVLVTHDGTVTDDAVVEAGRKAGVTLTPAGAARPVRS
jgi:hypothetical protein